MFVRNKKYFVWDKKYFVQDNFDLVWDMNNFVRAEGWGNRLMAFFWSSTDFEYPIPKTLIQFVLNICAFLENSAPTIIMRQEPLEIQWQILNLTICFFCERYLKNSNMFWHSVFFDPYLRLTIFSVIMFTKLSCLQNQNKKSEKILEVSHFKWQFSIFLSNVQYSWSFQNSILWNLKLCCLKLTAGF